MIWFGAEDMFRKGAIADTTTVARVAKNMQRKAADTILLAKAQSKQ